jgi:hypothetical protein
MVGDDECGRVRQQKCDAVAWTDSRRNEASSYPLDLGAQLTICSDLPVEGDGRTGREVSRRTVNLLGNVHPATSRFVSQMQVLTRLPAPVPILSEPGTASAKP